jgi:hypothetical protein
MMAGSLAAPATAAPDQRNQGKIYAGIIDPFGAVVIEENLLPTGQAVKFAAEACGLPTKTVQEFVRTFVAPGGGGEVCQLPQDTVPYYSVYLSASSFLP